ERFDRLALEAAPDDPVTRTLLATRAERVPLITGSADSAQRLRALVAADSSGLPEPRIALARVLRIADSPEASSALEDALGALPPFALQTRMLLRLEAALSPEALRVVLTPRRDSLTTAERALDLAADSAVGAFFAALLFAEAGALEAAWAQGRAALARGLREASGDPVDAASVDLVLARLALRAGAAPEASRLALRAETAWRAAGREDAARLASDLRQQAIWASARNR
ncbi:MAG: hypothetical protein AAFQ43_14945, partial [Bacteroidota bacterium]